MSDEGEVRNQLSKTINSLIRLARTLKEMEKEQPAPPDEIPSMGELIIENRLLKRKAEEVWKWKLENYSTADIEEELVRRRKKMELQRDSYKDVEETP